MVPAGTYPGIDSDNEVEADLDLEWAGAVARWATLVYVYSEDATYSAYYAIDNNLGPVISESFGLCEYQVGSSGWAFTTMRWRRRKAMRWEFTWLAASGDSGPAGCDYQVAVSTQGLELAFPPAFPRSPRWAGRNSTKEAAAIGVAPTGSMVARRYPISPRRRGTTQWQAGTCGQRRRPECVLQEARVANRSGVPNDGVRDVPDVALAASNAHDPYIIVTGGRPLAWAARRSQRLVSPE